MLSPGRPCREAREAPAAAAEEEEEKREKDEEVGEAPRPPRRHLARASGPPPHRPPRWVGALRGLAPSPFSLPPGHGAIGVAAQ